MSPVEDGVVDELGAPVALEGVPQRIVSLVPSLSETLWWFHAADRVVGVTDYCVAPPHVFPRAERVRGTKNPDVRAIIALEPDLVIANQEENRALDVERLREAGVSVYVTAPATVLAAADTLKRLGELVGNPGAGTGLAQAIHRALDAAAARRVSPPLTTFCPVWRDPWMATGRATYAADLLAHCGFAVVPEDDDGRYPHVELDDLAGRGIDAVLLPDEPYAFGEDDRAAFAGWDTRVRRIDGTQLTWYGPRMPYALGELTRLGVSIRRRIMRSGARGRGTRPRRPRA